MERYTVQCLRSGQPRPYADSVEEYRVAIEWQGPTRKNDPADKPFIPRPELNKDAVLRILKGLCGGWCDQGEGHVYSRRLDKCEMVEPGVWKVIIVQPFTD
jgi:hypothetical protein